MMKKQNLEALRAVDEVLREVLGQDFYEDDADMFLARLEDIGFVVVKEDAA